MSVRDTAELLRDAQLYVLLDGRDSSDSFAQLAQVLVEAGVNVLQLRDKRLPDRDLVERARVLRQLTAGSDTLFIVNDRPDIAVLSDADGVHVGQDELSAADCRTIVGSTRLIGVSTHSLGQARQATLDGADYIGCGPTFPSQTKAFEDFPGLEFLRAVRAEIPIPAFAIGGINGENIADVVEAGFRRVAVSGAVMAATDPAAAVRSLCQIVRGPKHFTACGRPQEKG
jgi:thiamine-phosphate pyrophosphorylase